ncbi:unnamed protein product [Mycena citricolor]|uniref:Integrase catalytic domain-containing protein n=1 Tax=Mycena citricolor TaxID=2018698 RepID=A0AAD2HZC6_9AGAR|nr:unnamed protein product [Mycena citricolor]
MFQFTLKHVRGITFSPDGLSRRRPAPGDKEYPNDKEEIFDKPPPENNENWDYDTEQPLDFEEFKRDIDTRGGYLNSMVGCAESVDNISKKLVEACDSRRAENRRVKDAYDAQGLVVPVFMLNNVANGEPLLPDLELRDNPEDPYIEDHRTGTGIEQDNKFSRQFFLKDGKMYKRSTNGIHRLVVDKHHRTYMMKACHDALGHKGLFSTKSLLETRFWWPEMERDVDWWRKTCHSCQVRQKTLLRTPPTPTMTPSVFQKIHTDVMIMGTPSNGYRYVVAARDSLTRYVEARPLQADNAKAIARFLLKDIVCCWGCPKWIVTDNAGQFVAALNWLQKKYGIKGIRISPYNSQANGTVERGHWDIRQSLYKATGGNASKWFWFFPQVLWADRITVRRGLGCSAYFAVCGAHPTIPLDIVEATWLVKYPDRIVDSADLIGLRARALAKHADHIEDMRSHVSDAKLKMVQHYELEYKHVIKDYKFVPGDLVLVRNTAIEKSLDNKMKARYLGPMIVVRKTKGGSYLVCEMNGAMFHAKVAAFRVIPYLARQKLTLSEDIKKLIDISPAKLDELVEEISDVRDYQFEGVKLKNSDSDDDDDPVEDPASVE